MGLLTDHNSNIQDIPDFDCLFEVARTTIFVYMNAYESLLGCRPEMNQGLHQLHADMIEALLGKSLEIINGCFEKFVRTAVLRKYSDSDFPYRSFAPEAFPMLGLSPVLNEAVKEVLHGRVSTAWDGRYDFCFGCKWIGRNRFTVIIYPDRYQLRPWFEINAAIKWD